MKNEFLKGSKNVLKHPNESLTSHRICETNTTTNSESKNLTTSSTKNTKTNRVDYVSLYKKLKSSVSFNTKPSLLQSISISQQAKKSASQQLEAGKHSKYQNFGEQSLTSRLNDLSSADSESVPLVGNSPKQHYQVQLSSISG